MRIPPLHLQLIYDKGRPTRAVIDIEALEALLEAAEDLDDIEYLNSLKEEDLEVVSFDEYLRESQRRREAEQIARSKQSDSKNAKKVRDRHRKAG
ncbi:MAG: hypothetical protein L0Y44_04240 [Phycisphaerales bacterium]|nr:hypothetical protein [Phycisphaerales bacterium]MCI0629848.1 hypothetical protein [Phycisphaerales bacterium]MCI0674859.1 hypothetical protein [Phycisphaerales bacterium]